MKAAAVTTRCAHCGAPATDWAQFPQGHALSCDDCTVAGGGWRRGEGPVSIAMPEATGASAPRLQSCFRRDAVGRLCHLPKGHEGPCCLQ